MDFFILADAKYDFICHIDVYEGNNTENIEIHPSPHKIPTRKKYVSNYRIKSVIEHNSCGYRHLYM